MIRKANNISIYIKYLRPYFGYTTKEQCRTEVYKYV